MSRAVAAPESPDPIGYWARHAPDRVALVDRRTGARLSYAALHALGDRWADRLGALDVGREDRVGVLSRNRVELIGLFLGCGRVGAALVPYNWRLAAAELAGIVEDSAPAVVYVDTESAGLADEVRARGASSTPWLELETAVADSTASPGSSSDACPATDARPATDPEAAALVLYTSGSTGRPKGALLPHRQLFHNAVATATAWELGPHDVAPITTPLFHTGGWNVFATPLWHRGGRVVLFDDFEPSGFMRAVAEERCTVALTVPTQLLLLQRCDEWGTELPRLRFFISGGAPCPPAVAGAVRAAGYRFKEGYGLTECGPNCFALSLEEAAAKPGAVGRPVPFLRARRVDAHGTDVGPGEEGELLLRGPQVFSGYLNAPDRTRNAFTPDGWLRTGDIARMDEDGVYTICGRRKEMFISGGENVFPAEVEAVLADAPGVAEVVVVGVADPVWGEVGRAYVVLGETTGDPDEAMDRIRRFARQRLAGYKVPKSFVALDAIPRLGSGKPHRARLAAAFGSAAPSRAPRPPG